MNIHFILSIGSLLLMTIVPMAMHMMQLNKRAHLALITIWILSVATVYIYLAVVIILAD